METDFSESEVIIQYNCNPHISGMVSRKAHIAPPTLRLHVGGEAPSTAPSMELQAVDCSPGVESGRAQAGGDNGDNGVGD